MMKYDTGDSYTISEDGCMMIPSASRNKDAIIKAIMMGPSKHGCCLEIASGTGEHIIGLAQSMPRHIWQPTELDPVKLDSIRAWRKAADLSNVNDPIVLDATVSGWSEKLNVFDCVLIVNFLHLICEDECETLVNEAAKALKNGGFISIYGPFLRNVGFASDADQCFDAKLKAQNSTIGYKNVDFVMNILRKAGFATLEVCPMPANNLMLLGAIP